ncbi:MAG: triose-phosphate isomerase [Candidatus Taylorbacteria bacterium]|nr:triose-phosphate isomerase [Candidatus Taylorbacteria bacterium]
MKKLIIANWKNHPDTLAEAEDILDFTNNYLEAIEVKPHLNSLVFCPPFVFIEEVAKMLQMSHFKHDAFLGAQDIAAEDKTALTGLVEGYRGSEKVPVRSPESLSKPEIAVEVSGPMLNKLGARYVIIGHSERRWKLGESDEVVNKKLKSALRNELIPIVCIGERVRDNNFKKFLEEQVKMTFEGLTADEVGKCIIAYEPVWAISTNLGARPDTPSSALESISHIRKILNTKYKIQDTLFLYGGSVNSKNAGDFLKEKEIDGVLIGGASVIKKEFVKILEIASRI